MMKGILKLNKIKGLSFKQCISHKQALNTEEIGQKKEPSTSTQFKCYWWCFHKTHDIVMASDHKEDCFNLFNLNKRWMPCSNLPMGASLWSFANQWVHSMNERWLFSVFSVRYPCSLHIWDLKADQDLTRYLQISPSRIRRQENKH